MNIIVIDDPIYQGEGKWFKFTYTVPEGVDLSSAVFSFAIKKELSDTEVEHSADDDEMDKSQIASNIVRANLPASVSALMETGHHYAQMEAIITPDTDVDKTKIAKFKLLPSVV